MVMVVLSLSVVGWLFVSLARAPVHPFGAIGAGGGRLRVGRGIDSVRVRLRQPAAV